MRGFLGTLCISLAIPMGTVNAHSKEKPALEINMLSRTRDVFVIADTVNVGAVRDGSRILLIDFGSGAAGRELRDAGQGSVERILLTHHHRDQAYGLLSLSGPLPVVWVPAAERPWFDAVESYWSDPKSRWHLYDFHPHRLMLTQSVPVAGVLEDGQSFSWGSSAIRAISTPGHTTGSMSYLVQSNGKRILFCGDLLYEGGRVWDLHSLQKAEGPVSDYHGFLGARKQLLESLKKVKDLAPDLIVPSHGPIVPDPARCVDLLRDRLEALYERYAEISALRHYYPQVFEGMPDGKIHGTTAPPPPFLRHIGTSWIIESEAHAFVVDCGTPEVADEIEALVKKGDLKAIDVLWISHTHDDHVDGIPAFLGKFRCPVYTDRSVAQVVEDPLAWRLPCISPFPIKVDHVVRHGESWTWRGLKMTGFHLPGQSEYHSGLLVEGHGLRLLFAGDSFTPTGIDDYCIQNRNLIGEGLGFQKCVQLVRDLRPDWIFNCHVNEGFRFSDEECALLLESLRKRARQLREILPWTDPNQGMDELWLRVSPYEQAAPPGSKVDLALTVTVHDGREHRLSFRPLFPASWPCPSPDWISGHAPGNGETQIPFSLALPTTVPSGRQAIPIEVQWDDGCLGPLADFILVLP